MQLHVKTRKLHVKAMMDGHAVGVLATEPRSSPPHAF